MKGQCLGLSSFCGAEAAQWALTGCMNYNYKQDFIETNIIYKVYLTPM